MTLQEQRALEAGYAAYHQAAGKDSSPFPPGPLDSAWNAGYQIALEDDNDYWESYDCSGDHSPIHDETEVA